MQSIRLRIPQSQEPKSTIWKRIPQSLPFLVFCRRLVSLETKHLPLAFITRRSQLPHRNFCTSITATMKYLNQEEAINVDVDLFNEYKYSVDQLMELAGLSCAHSIAKCYRRSAIDVQKSILVCCGPGNNGGDGLVCARHLAILGYKCTIYYPKRTDKQLYRNLVAQCNAFGDAINFIDNCPIGNEFTDNYALIIDALFGFSFRPPVRDTFLPIIRAFETATIPIVRWELISSNHQASLSIISVRTIWNFYWSLQHWYTQRMACGKWATADRR